VGIAPTWISRHKLDLAHVRYLITHAAAVEPRLTHNWAQAPELLAAVAAEYRRQATFRHSLTIMDADEFVTKFGTYVDERSASVFVGAGLSMAAGYPNWQELTKPFRQQLRIQKMDDLPQLVQYYQDNVPGGRPRIDDHVTKAIEAITDPRPTRSHQLLGELPIEVYWTTNYDPLLEMAIDGAHAITEDRQLAEHVPPGSRLIYKMHGSVSPTLERGGPSGTPLHVILSRDDYERYPETHPRFWSVLQAYFLTRTFLFLGFSFTDPNLEHVFRLVRLRISDIPRQHFAVLRRPDSPAEQRLHDLRRGELEAVGIRVVEIADHAEIEPLLLRLVARARPFRVFLSGSPLGPRAALPGSYPVAELPEELVEFAEQLGALLAGSRLRLMTGGTLGATVGYEFARQLRLQGRYDPDRFVLLRRYGDAEVNYPNRRIGTIIFTDGDPTDLRTTAFEQVRALLVLGGQEGTAWEITQARELGYGIVPIATTGGAAQQAWRAISDDWASYRLGGRPVDKRDFDLLNSNDAYASAAAAVRLLQQALFMT
jgi:SIR2-like domain